MNPRMSFVFEQIRTGGDRNFGYLIGDRTSGEALLVDPSFDPDALVDRATGQGLGVKWIVNTHGHGDHTNGNSRAQKLTRAGVAAHRAVIFPTDLALDEGSTLLVGDIQIRVIYVPGHTDDHIALFLPEQKVALTGDHLFVGKIGGTNSDEAAREEYDSLQRLFRELPDDTTIWPGHDYGCRPSSTVLLEKETNPFLLVSGVEEFLSLKRDWASFKAKNGLC